MHSHSMPTLVFALVSLSACGAPQEPSLTPAPPSSASAPAPALPTSAAAAPPAVTPVAVPSASAGTAAVPSATPKHPDPSAVDVEVGRRFGLEAFPSLRKQINAASSARPDKSTDTFGLYVLALSWAPNFCCGHESKEQCDGLANSFGATHLTIHGLWPNYSDAEAAKKGVDYPTFCGTFKACKGKNSPDTCYPNPSDIPSDMSKYGPGYVSDDYFLANHEWPKHGSCSGLDAKSFFSDTVGALLKLPGEEGTPDFVRKHVGEQVTPTELATSFGAPKSVLLSCDAACSLSQVSLCLGHDAKGNPTSPVACPNNVTQSDYDNGCITHHCAKIRLQKAGECSVHDPGEHTGDPATSACSHPGQGPACSNDGDCTDQGFLRCARSGCCTTLPR